MKSERQQITGYLFNMVIYAHDERRTEYFSNLVHAFIEKYPCRLIFINGNDNTNEDPLEIGRAPCTAGEVCDRLMVSASLSTLTQVPFLILPYLIPDLPIYLIWGQNPTSENKILPHMQKLASRLVYDAECVHDLRDFSKKMLSKIEELPIDFMDVGWAEISGWRDAITKTFHSPQKVALLQQSRRILIKYNRLQDPFFKHFATQAIYFQGWLAAQLKWKYQSISYEGDIISILYNNREVILQPQKRASLSHGSLFEVEFLTSENLSITLSLAEIQSKILVYFSAPEKCELPFSVPFPDVQKGLTAMKEIFYYRTSEHYSNMLRTLSEVEWKQF